MERAVATFIYRCGAPRAGAVHVRAWTVGVQTAIRTRTKKGARVAVLLAVSHKYNLKIQSTFYTRQWTQNRKQNGHPPRPRLSVSWHVANATCYVLTCNRWVLEA